MAFIPSPASSGGGGGTIKLGYGAKGPVAKYVMVSTHSSILSVRYFDQDFGNMVPQFDQHEVNTTGSFVNEHSGHFHIESGSQTYSHYQATAYGMYANRQTSSQVSSSSNMPPMSASMMSQVGSPYVGHYSDGSFSNKGVAPSGGGIQWARTLINSDHTDKSICYSMKGDYLAAVDLGMMSHSEYSNSGHQRADTQRQQISALTGGLAPGFSMSASMSHNASYNHKRKELLIASLRNSNGEYHITIYTGIDFDANPSPKAAFAAAGVGKQQNFIVNIGSNWNLNNNETYYNPWFVLCNDGGIRVASWQESNGMKWWRFDRLTSGGTQTGTYQGGTSGTTSYGQNQGIQFGTSMVQSTDGKTIAIQAPYYYYHAGCVSVVFDKTNSNTSPIQAQSTSSADVRYWVPYRDDGLAFYQGGNGYAGNYSGISIEKIVTRRQSIETGTDANIIMDTGQSIYFPVFNNPNTTNYPGLIPTTDYHMHPYNFGAR